MITRPPQFASALAYGFEGSIDAGASMTVAAGDIVVLAQFGSITRVIGPGSYQVPAEFAGAGVEAWFISTRPRADIKFGGPINLGGVKAIFGTCSLRVVSAETFAKNLVGQRPGVMEGVEKAAAMKLVVAAKDAAASGGSTAVPNACQNMATELQKIMGLEIVITDLNVT